MLYHCGSEALVLAFWVDCYGEHIPCALRQLFLHGVAKANRFIVVFAGQPHFFFGFAVNEGLGYFGENFAREKVGFLQNSLYVFNVASGCF